MAIEVFRVRDYGGEMVKTGANTGRGTEFYSVNGCAWEEIVAAQASGLPIETHFHADSRLSYVGPVRYVGPYRSWGPLTWLAIVVYSSSGSLAFSTKIGSTSTDLVRQIDIPVMRKYNGNTYGLKQPAPFILRGGYRRVESRLWNGSTSTIGDIATRNVGRTYHLDGLVWMPGTSSLPYRLLGAAMTTDPAGYTRIDTAFSYWAPLKGSPVNTYTGQDVVIPDLPANAEWDPDTLSGVVGVTQPENQYAVAEDLPWLL